MALTRGACVRAIAVRVGQRAVVLAGMRFASLVLILVPTSPLPTLRPVRQACARDAK
jgi:hypothetical protein